MKLCISFLLREKHIHLVGNLLWWYHTCIIWSWYCNKTIFCCRKFQIWNSSSNSKCLTHHVWKLAVRGPCAHNSRFMLSTCKSERGIGERGGAYLSWSMSSLNQTFTVTADKFILSLECWGVILLLSTVVVVVFYVHRTKTAILQNFGQNCRRYEKMSIKRNGLKRSMSSVVADAFQFHTNSHFTDLQEGCS